MDNPGKQRKSIITPGIDLDAHLGKLTLPELAKGIRFYQRMDDLDAKSVAERVLKEKREELAQTDPELLVRLDDQIRTEQREDEYQNEYLFYRTFSDEFNTILQDIDLNSIWLQEASIVNHHGSGTPDDVNITLDPAGWDYKIRSDGFRVHQEFVLNLGHKDTTLAEIEVTFALDYSSKKQVPEPFIQAFVETSLPYTVWPYLREYFASTLSRMGWQPFTLPSLTTEDERGIYPTTVRTRSTSTLNSRSAAGYEHLLP